MLALALVLLVLSAPLETNSAGSSSLPESPTPKANIAPTPDFLNSGACTMASTGIECANPCVNSEGSWPNFTNDPSCTEYLLSAINAARATLDEVPMALPSNWYVMTPPEQLFVLANLERIGLGYPPYLGLNAMLSGAAQTAAQEAKDPNPAPNFRVGVETNGFAGIGGAWSEGFNALEADYIWMYDDGWGGSTGTTANITCTSANAAGCWGHRQELLGSDPLFKVGVGLECRTCEMGAGYALVKDVGQWDDLIELPVGTPPSMTFTWASEVQYFALDSLSPAISTTTTTSMPMTPQAPQSATVHRLVLRPDFIKVSWSSLGTEGVTHVNLSTFSGYGCRTAAVGLSSRYSPLTNTTGGTISWHTPAWRDTHAAYSASVRVFNASGSFVSPCVSLGRS